MYTKTNCAFIKGIDADPIQIEVDSSKGIPGFNIVGLADRSINEAKERISTAMRASELEIPPHKILVNLSPAHIKKEGVHFDLAITAAVMVNCNFIDIIQKTLNDFVFFGELSLKGEVKFCKDLLILALSKKIPQKYFVVPQANLQEAQIIQKVFAKSKTVFVIKDLYDLKAVLELMHNSSKELLESFKVKDFGVKTKNLGHIKDFSEVIGQRLAKRALEVAAAGQHHLLMLGPPGCGKTMLASRFIELLPKLSLSQAIESTKLFNAYGYQTSGLIEKAPLRKPHHSLSAAAFVGGGNGKIKPGEVSLAHNGVLFLDEMTEFSRHTLDQLRQILEEKSISIRRVNNSETFPADFLLLGACNPCPCGYLGDKEKNCRCSQIQIEKYLGKLSGPLLDRIDIHLRLNRIDQEGLRLLSQNTQKNYSTKEMLTNIKAAQNFAKATKPEIELNLQAQEILEKASSSLKLSARSHQKIIRVARTIANLAQSKKIQAEHISESLQYRQNISLN